jgi:hypothetical protein
VAGPLILMKLTVLRREARGPRSGWVLGGAMAGLALAAVTIGAATLRARSPGTVADLLGVVFAVWALGWMLGPAYSGQPLLRAEQFRLLPIPRRRLALGLLGTAFAGVTAPVTFIAFTALVVFGIRLGMVPALIALPAVVLQLILVVLLSRVTGSLFGALSRSRAGAVVSALVTAVMLVAISSGWIVLAALHPLVATGFPAGFAAAVRALPSSWAVVAVEASSRSDWLMTAAPLLGLIAVLLLLGLTWERSLGPARWPRPAVRGSPAGRAAPRHWMPAGATAAALVKELRTWRRDPQRLNSLVVPPAFAVMTCLVPAALGTRAFLPFLGALTALMAAVTSANLYGQDGTALWLTLLIPGSERADVRGRQLAWLVLFAPMTLVLTAAGVAASGRPDLWPGVLAATFALLGGGAGLLPAVAVALPAPRPGPRDRKNAPLGDTDELKPALVMLFLALATAVPAAGTVLAGELTGRPALRWAALAVGAITGMLSYTLLGRAAQRSLVRRGPELLSVLRTRTEHPATPASKPSLVTSMPRYRRRLLWCSLLTGCIAIFPQALVPLLMKLSGGHARVWFLALYLPGAWQWPVITLMFLLGLASLGLAARIWATARRPRLYLRDSPGSGGQAIPSSPRHRKRPPLGHTSLTRPLLRHGTGTDATRIAHHGRSSPRPNRR